MEKVKINGKEIEIDEKDLKPLTDEELEAATGGYILRDGVITLFRRECTSCGAKSPYYTIEDRNSPEAEIKHNSPCSGGPIEEVVRCYI